MGTQPLNDGASTITNSKSNNRTSQRCEDLRRAEEVYVHVTELQSRGQDQREAIRNTAQRFEYTPQYVRMLIQISQLSGVVKKIIEENQISARAALLAQQIGGTTMVEAAARRNLSQHSLEAMWKELRNVQSESVRKQILQELVEGEITQPAEIPIRARLLAVKRRNAPRDFDFRILQWTAILNNWIDQLNDLKTLEDFIHAAPEQTEEFRSTAREVIDRLRKMT